MLLDLYAWLLLWVWELLGVDVRLLLGVWELPGDRKKEISSIAGGENLLFLLAL